jgi:haloacetate dehalogenase
MFDGFERERVRTSEAEINLVRGGSGPPVLLLHGYPQTHAMWHAVAPRLAERFTVVAADLRGYGDSSKPPGGDDHAGYSKRAMAADQLEAMAALGFERFALVGHDRGARVAHRLAFDHPERVTRLALLDIVPTWEVFQATDQAIATTTYHWFFLIQPDGLPERLIGAEPEYFLREMLRRWSAGVDSFFDAEAVAEYVRCFRAPEAIHASCEDYRAGASIDLVHDEADLGRTVDIPLLVLWGGKGKLNTLFDVLAVWGARFPDVHGRALSCGHFLAEELPEETAAELLAFLAE